MKKSALLLISILSFFASYSQCDATHTSTHIDCDSIWFVPNATGSQYTYTWDFGDGGSSSSSSPTHVYNTNGTYTVILILQDTVANCSNAFTSVVTVNCGASCGLSAFFATSVNGSNCEVFFNATQTGGTGPYTYFWDFGDGSTSTLLNPTHQYPNNSFWTPCLTVTDALGCDTTVCNPVQVNCTPQPCDPSFTHSYATCDSLFFFPVSQGTQYSYSWDFGDGSSSTQANPGHQYSADGVYQVILVLTDNVAGCTVTELITIVINCGSGCNVDGAFNSLVDTSNCSVQFVSTAYGGTAPYTYFWDFGDGTNSTSASPNHIYSTYGPTWNVCLTITDVNGCDTTICSPIIVDCIQGSCDANFQFNQPLCNVFDFFPVSIGTQYQYFWDFGDGQFDNSPNPSHTYQTYSNYTVTLILVDFVAGCSDTVSWDVSVNCGNSCTVDGDFVYNTDPNCYTSFSSTAWGGQQPYSYSWNFGDGTTGNSPNPTHYYPNNSTWTPCLTITDINGCDTTICQPIQINCAPAPCDANFTYTFALCDSVFFYPVANGTQYSYSWNFGDGSTSTQSNPGHQFASDGNYSVLLIVTDNVTGCQATWQEIITINCGVTNCTTQGAFNAQVDTSSCSVQFFSTAFGGTAPYTYFWDFGDGSNSTSASPNHQYPFYGPSWQVCLTITDANGCDTTICDIVVVDCVPGSCDASFQYTYQDCQTVVFYPISTGAQYAYWWDFGDGSTSTNDNPGHIYSTNGVYTVTLILDDLVANCSDTVSLLVTVNCATNCTVNGDFVFNTDPNCYTSFSATAWGGLAPYTYFWDFGDGTTGTSSNPTHYYPNNSGWYPCLTITDASGCDTTICDSLFTSCATSSCNAAFTYSYVGCDSIYFIPVSSGPQYSYSWYFGDGTSSTLENPSHTFANGTWIVQLVVTDSIAGCGDQTFVTLTINCGFTPCTTNGAFNWSVDSTSCDVQFVSTAFGGTAPYTYYWNFGDGTSSTSPNPVHSYPNNSVWTPCLTISDANGCDTTICDVVQVNCTATSCDASFQFTYQDCQTVVFYPISTGAQYSYYWDFGDGSSSTSDNPGHIYSSDGVYVVTLTITDNVAGCTDVFNLTITVNCGTTCTIDGAFQYTIDPNNCDVHFYSSAWGGQAPYTYYWNFGDGSTSSLSNPIHNYPNNSVWTPCLTITDVNGCDTTICDVVNVQCVSNNCDAAFNYTYITCDSIWFVPSTNNPQYNYLWDFGDGTTSTDISPAHSFANGVQTVVLYISDSLSGCSNAYTVQITINCGAQCDLSGAVSWYNDSTSCDVSFISTAYGGQAPYTYFWNFGDGATSNLANPVHNYAPNTQWTPCLTITDVNGCDTTICEVVYPGCTVGIEEFDDNVNALIYPNPTNGQLTIVLEGLERIEVYDLSGKLVYYEDSFSDQLVIDLDFVEDGSYLVRTFANDETTIQQIIKH